jgi:CheY-specific phosphatase CheX
MDVQFIKSLINCTNAVLEELISVKTVSQETSIQQGASTYEGNGVVLKVTGDIDGEMAGESDLHSMADTKEEYIELLKSVILEFGNLINGRIISTMHTHNYECESVPDRSYYENYAILAPKNVSSVVIETKTNAGDFYIYVTNKKEKFLENITVVMHDIYDTIALPVINKYTPKGFFFLRSDSHEKTESFLRNKNATHILINLDNISNAVKTVEDFTLIKPDIKVILFATADTSFIPFQGKNSVEIIGYIQNNNPEEALLANIDLLFEKTGIRKSERRQHVRVKVSLMDNARVSFNYKGVNIKGDLLDVGTGGIHFAVGGDAKEEMFTFGEKISSIKVFLKDKEISASGTIRSISSGRVNLEFLDLNEKSLDYLSQYISERVSNQSGL